MAAVSPSPTAIATPSPTPSPSPSPTPTPEPTPTPTPEKVPAPLTGRLVSVETAQRHPISVMIDDLGPARPQSGLSSADVVWHAPAEGGIPRYLAIFQSRMNTDIGPVRSARVYYIAWASEWNALYAHSGGSPQALRQLESKGQGEWVFDANEFRYGGGAFDRSPNRAAPHNVYTDGPRMRRLGARLGAKDGDLEPVWQFGPDAALEERPTGGTIKVPYPQNTVTYRYDRETNTYPRGVTGEKKQIDAATDKQVAPKNVVIMYVTFVDSGDSKSRLEADIIGKGKAVVHTNGRAIPATWEKRNETDPTRFVDSNGQPIVFTVGQTFIQVVPKDLKVTTVPGE